MIISREQAEKTLEKQKNNLDSAEKAEKNFLFLKNQSRMEQIRIREREEILEMRKSWSKWILRSILAIISFDFFVIVSIGLKWFSFDGFIVPVFITESLIKTLGLAIIIVNFLFNKKDTEL